MGAKGQDAERRIANERLRWQRLWDEIPTASTSVVGNVLAPPSVEHLMVALKQASLVGMGAWRGQADASWRLDSSLVRRWIKHQSKRGVTKPPTEIQIRKIEEAIVEEAREAGFVEPESELELLARVQHHGGATRLLDATRNAFVALWFACQGQPEKDGVLLGFRLAEDRAMRVTSSYLRQDLSSILKKADGRLIWWKPRNLTPRIAAQQAVVVFSETVDRPWGSIAFSGEVEFQDTGGVPGLIAILVSTSLKIELNAHWDDLFGYTQASMFPDFDGFSQSHGAQNSFPIGFRL